MRYWLMKSEPDEVSFDDVLAAPQRTVAWFGVRNYQARNFMRDQMQVGDGILFYHSSCAVPGVAGIRISDQVVQRAGRISCSATPRSGRGRRCRPAPSPGSWSTACR